MLAAPRSECMDAYEKLAVHNTMGSSSLERRSRNAAVVRATFLVEDGKFWVDLVKTAGVKIE